MGTDGGGRSGRNKTESGVTKTASSTADGDEAWLMDYAPGRVLQWDELVGVKGAVAAKLSELMNEPCDEVFPEYITVMVNNGKSIREICAQLEDLVTPGTAPMFSKWLGRHLRAIETGKSPPDEVNAAGGKVAMARKVSGGTAAASSNTQVRSPSAVGLTSSGSADSKSQPMSSVKAAGGESAETKGSKLGNDGISGTQAKKAKASGSKVTNSSLASKGKAPRDRSRSRSRSRSQSRSRSHERSRGGDRERSRERDKDWSRDRDRDRDWSDDGDEERSRDGDRERSRDRDRDRNRDRSRERSRERGRSRDRDRERSRERDRDRERSRDRNRSRDRDRVREKDAEKRPRDSRDRERGRDRRGRAWSRDSRERPREHHTRERDSGSYRGRERSRDGRRGGTAVEFRHYGGSGGMGRGSRSRDRQSRQSRNDARNDGNGSDMDFGSLAGERGGRHGKDAAKEGVGKDNGGGGGSGGDRYHSSPGRSVTGKHGSAAETEHGVHGPREPSGDVGDGAEQQRSGEAKKTETSSELHGGREGNAQAGKGTDTGEGNGEAVHDKGAAKAAKRGGPRSTAVLVSSPRSSRDPPKPTVMGAISVVGGSAKERLEREREEERERAKLPDLRMVIERSRRRTRKGEDEATFAQQALNGKSSVGGKRSLASDRPAAMSKAYVPPAARLLSSAVMQSLQSVRDRSTAPTGEATASGSNGSARGGAGLGASNGGGEKRRKSGDGTRYLASATPTKTPGNLETNPNGKRAHSFTEENMDGSIVEGNGDDRNPAEGARLHMDMALESSPTSSAALAVTNSAVEVGEGEHGVSGGGGYAEGATDPTWQPWNSGEDGDDGDDGDYGGYGGYDGAVGHAEEEHYEEEEPYDERVSPEVEYRQEQEQEEGEEAVHQTPSEVETFDRSHHLLEGSLQTPRHGPAAKSEKTPELRKQWDSWFETVATNPGSAPDAAVKWVNTLRAAVAVMSDQPTPAEGNTGAAVLRASGARGVRDVSHAVAASSSGRGEDGVVTTPVRDAGAPGWGRGATGRNSWARGRGWARGRSMNGGWGFVRGGGRLARGGGRVARGRGRGAFVPLKNLGRGGGWHSSGSSGRGSVESPSGSSAGGGTLEPGSSGHRETWHKVWVRKDSAPQISANSSSAGGSGAAGRTRSESNS